MAFKHLSREREKQQILRIDLGLYRTGNTDLPVVATAESERITFFWPDLGGEWRFWARPHARIRARTDTPARINRYNWSSRMGVAAGDGFVALVYKRQLDQESDPRLYIDILQWQEAGETYTPIQDTPFQVPIDALGFNRAGFDLWAEIYDGRLAIVAQLTPDDAPNSPRLAFLDTPASSLVELDLENPDAWRVITIDDGGYDFDARREGKEIHIVHRRRAALIVADLSQAGIWGYFISENGESGEKIEDVYDPLVYARLDVPAGSASLISENIGFGEHPQIHSVSPPIITADLPDVWHINGTLSNPKKITLRPLNAYKHLMLRFPSGWASAKLYPINLERFPTNLEFLLPGQYLMALEDSRLEISTPVGLYPTLLVDYRDQTSENKDQILAFAHHDWQMGGLVVSFFSAAEYPPGDIFIQSNGRALWDLNHAQIDQPQEHPAENTQFRPLPGLLSHNHPGGFTIERNVPFVNTIGGLLVGHSTLPHTFHAYVDMGDRGGRVIFAPGATLPEPKFPPDVKEIVPEMIPAAGNDHQWVRLFAPIHIPSDLPGYPVPYINLRLVTSLFPALGSGLQPLLDFLPHLDQVAEFGQVFEESVDFLSITPERAGAIQTLITSLVPNGPVFQMNEPFRVRYNHTPGVLFARTPIGFSAQIENSPGEMFYVWVFENLDNDTAANITRYGPQVEVEFDPGGRYRLRLAVYLTPGFQFMEVSRDLDVIDSLWALLWQFHQEINTPPTQSDGTSGDQRFRLDSLSIQLSRHKINYILVAGTPSRVDIEYLEKHASEYRFRRGPGPTQGEIDYRLNISLESTEIFLAGSLSWLSTWIRVDNVDIRLRHGATFTPGVLTSDRRSIDSIQNVTFNRLGRLDEETMAISSRMIPAGLATKPVGGAYTEIASSNLNISLTNTAKNSVWVLAGVLMVLGFGPALLMGLLVVLLAMGVGLGLGALALIGLTIAAIVTVLISLGLTWLLTEVVAPALFTHFGNEQLRQSLQHQQPDLHASLLRTNLLRYAGEGLAESLAIKSIELAQAQGLGVDDPTEDGLNRKRSALFEMIIVTEGECNILMRK